MSPLVAGVLGLFLGALVGFLAGWELGEKAYAMDGRSEMDDEQEGD